MEYVYEKTEEYLKGGSPIEMVDSSSVFGEMVHGETQDLGDLVKEQLRIVKGSWLERCTFGLLSSKPTSLKKEIRATTKVINEANKEGAYHLRELKKVRDLSYEKEQTIVDNKRSYESCTNEVFGLGKVREKIETDMQNLGNDADSLQAKLELRKDLDYVTDKRNQLRQNLYAESLETVLCYQQLENLEQTALFHEQAYGSCLALADAGKAVVEFSEDLIAQKIDVHTYYKKKDDCANAIVSLGKSIGRFVRNQGSQLGHASKPYKKSMPTLENMSSFQKQPYFDASIVDKAKDIYEGNG